MKFSERQGFVCVNKIIQTSNINIQLKNTLWNFVHLFFLEANGISPKKYHLENLSATLSNNIWSKYFKKTIDDIPYNSYEVHAELKNYFFNCKWYEIYDFIEFLISLGSHPRIIDALNDLLARELSGYSVIDSKFIPITDESEISTIDEAISSPYTGTRIHLQQALENLSRRESPDYRNSIKESISAVESIAKEISGNPKATLGDAIKTIEKSGKLHSALKQGLLAIYGYTSDEQGIRHAMLEESNLDIHDAKFFLVMCSTFVNYLKVKAN